MGWQPVQWKLGLALAVLLGAAFVVVAPTGATQTAEPMKFGMNMGSLDAQTAAGARPDYGTFWVGSWTLQHGWGGPDKEFDRAYSTGTTPVIQFYYWGDDISVSCIENGCDSGLHGAHKDKAGWQRLADELVDHLDARMKGREAIVILETEFNKGGVSRYEPVDGYLAEKAHFIKQGYPAARIVLGFGNWGSADWGTFDRAAAASDMVGIQGMRGSTRNSLDSYLGLVDATLEGAKTLASKFDRPILVTDIALSSYPEPEYVEHQRAVLASLLARVDEFHELGVVGIVYRTYMDNPSFDTKNYFGEAERHWGLVRAYDGGAKPSLQVWVDGVNAERSQTEPPTVTADAGFLHEVEDFAVHTTGRRSNDSSASAHGAWNLWANGYAETTFVVATGGLHEVAFWARGNEAGGVPPHAVLSIDGKTIRQADPRAGSYQSFAAPVHLGQGAHAVRVSFTNDAIVAGEDRNLILDALTVSPLQRVEAESFATKTTGGRQGDSQASAGYRWNLWANGHIAQTLQAPADGDYVLRVRVKGDALNGVAPNMVIRVDGTVVRTASPGTSYVDVPVPLEALMAGEHVVRIDFTNDARTSTGDRNLLLDRVELARVG